MKAFGGEDGAEALGAFLGLNTGLGSIKGLGVGKGQSFDVVMIAEDGKINVNCGGGLNPTAVTAPGQPQQQPNSNGVAGSNPQQPGQPVPARLTNRAVGLYALLTAMEFGPRYNRIFDNPDPEGQYTTRDEAARAIIDWSDVDESRFEPLGAGGGSEDYRYDALKDGYRAHNNFYDTVEEVQLVKGIGDDYWGSFGELFTVYGGCKVNLNAVRPENWPITAAIIRATAKDQNNPVLLDDTMMAALAQQIGAIAQFMGGLQNVNDLSNFAQGKIPNFPSLGGGSGGSGGQQGSINPFPPIPGIQPVELNPADLAAIATVGPRQVYRIDSTGSVRRQGVKSIDVHIRAVFDTQHYNQNNSSIDPNDRLGTWVYWRME
jgi:hypothetical protein